MEKSLFSAERDAEELGCPAQRNGSISESRPHGHCAHKWVVWIPKTLAKKWVALSESMCKNTLVSNTM
jgi:hypothetical protein